MNLQYGYSIKGKPRHKCRRILLSMLMGRCTTKQNEYIAFVGDGIRCKRRGRKKSARYFTHTWLKLLGGNTGHNHILLSISEGQESYEHIKMIISDHLDILAEIERTEIVVNDTQDSNSFVNTANAPTHWAPTHDT